MSYVALANITLSANAQSVTFSSIPTTGYRDLVLVADFRASAVSTVVFLRANNLTGNSDYAVIGITGDGSTAGSFVSSGADRLNATNTNFELSPSSGSQRGALIANFFDYNQTNKHKSVLIKVTNGDLVTGATAGRVVTTSALTSISVNAVSTSGLFVTGSNFALYGIVG